MSSRAHVTPSGRLNLLAAIRTRHGLGEGGDVIVEDTGDAISIRTVDQVVARAQEKSRKFLSGKDIETVDDFIAARRRESARE